MKKYLITLATLIILVASFFVGFKIIKDMNQESNQNTPDNSDTNPTPDPDREAIIKQQAKDILDHMTLEQKVGQMLIIRNRYTEMTPEFEADITSIQPSGYVVFGENITTLSDTKQFIADTRQKIESASAIMTSDGAQKTIPAIMSVDQEGGIVQRLQSISDYPPEYVDSMSEIGATGSTDTAYKTGQLLAEQCRDMGLNVDYAPVADIFSNPKNTVIGNRAFGTDKETVATMSTALARGLKDSGVTPVYKHFPGHGDTTADSHFSLPVVAKTLEELKQNELYPFEKAIESGAEMIMVAHIALPNVTDDYTPASLSPKIVTDLLKTNLKYDGLVITDGLDMGALTENYTNAEIAVKAVSAGVDILLTPVSPQETKNAIVDAVNAGTITESRIDNSVLKILSLKLQYLK